MHRMTSKSTISNSTRSVEVTFWDTMIGQFLYMHLAIIGSPTGVETEKGSWRVSGLTLNWIASLSYKTKIHLCCLSTESTICESHPWVCRMPISPITTSYWHHTKYFLDLINELLESLPTYDPKNLSEFILTKSQTLVATNRSVLLVGTQSCWLFLLVILWAKSWIDILKLCILSSLYGNRGTVLALRVLAFHA